MPLICPRNRKKCGGVTATASRTSSNSTGRRRSTNNSSWRAGSSNRLGEFAANRPVHFQEIFATLYHNLGLDPSSTTIMDPTGRPQHLVEMPAMRELV